MDELEKLRKHWQDDDFQRKHALAREIVVNRLRELNREYEEKTGQGFVRFIETRMKTPESIAEKLQRKEKYCRARIMTWILIPQLLH